MKHFTWRRFAFLILAALIFLPAAYDLVFAGWVTPETVMETMTVTPTPSLSPTPSETPMPAATGTETPTPSPEPSFTPTSTRTPTPTSLPANTPTFTATPQPTNTPTFTPQPSNTPTTTNTPLPPTNTNTPQPPTNTPTNTNTPQPTNTPTNTSTPQPPTNTPTNTNTPQPTSSSTPSGPTPTPPQPTVTPTVPGPTATPTSTPSPTPTGQPPFSFAYFPAIFYKASPGEPNNNCQDAFTIAPVINYHFYANDPVDWYRFQLTRSGSLTIQLTDFVPQAGQVAVYRGTHCGDVIFLGSNGDFSTTKLVNLGIQPAGTYFVFVSNDGMPNDVTPYSLQARFIPAN